MSADFHLCVAKEGGSFTVMVSGEVDLATAGHLRSAADLALDSGACRSLALDLGAVTFIDCTGVAAMVAIAARSRQRSARFTLSRCSDAVRRVLELTYRGADFLTG